MVSVTSWLSQAANDLRLFLLVVPAIISNGAVITGSSLKIVFNLRSQQDRSALTSFIIVAAQSVKNTAIVENKGHDGGKNISSIKCHLAVDIKGCPQAIHITTANVSECDGAQPYWF